MHSYYNLIITDILHYIEQIITTCINIWTFNVQCQRSNFISIA